jgi:hypothetical protein
MSRILAGISEIAANARSLRSGPVFRRIWWTKGQSVQPAVNLAVRFSETLDLFGAALFAKDGMRFFLTIQGQQDIT